MASNQDDSIQETLDSLIGEMGKLNSHNEAMLGAIRSNHKQSSSNGKTFGTRIFRRMEGIPVLGRTIRMGHKAITDAINQSSKIQQSAVARGRELKNFTSELRESTTSMSTNMGGYSEILEAASMQWNAGLRGNKEETRRLGMFLNQTGGDWRRASKQIRSLTAGLDSNVDRAALLSNGLLGLANTFKVSVGELTSGMASLSSSLIKEKQLGIAPEIAQAFAALKGAVGGGMNEEIDALKKDLFSTDGKRLAIMMGVGKERDRLLKNIGDPTKNLLALVNKIAPKADRLNADARRSNDAMLFLDIQNTMRGQGMMVGGLISKGLATHAKVLGVGSDAMVALATKPTVTGSVNTWGSFRGKVTSGISDLITQGSTLAFSLLKSTGETGVAVGKAVSLVGGLGAALLTLKKFSGLAGLLGGGAAAGAAGAAGGGVLAGIGGTLASLAPIALGITALGGLAYGIYKLVDYLGEDNEMSPTPVLVSNSIANQSAMSRHATVFEEEKRLHRYSTSVWQKELLGIQRAQSFIFETINENIGVTNSYLSTSPSRSRPSPPVTK